MTKLIRKSGTTPEEGEEDYAGPTLSYTASLVSQGKHRFYTLTMPSDVLARCCTVEPRIENPMEGFQRKLDEKRAREIADYIDKGFGTIPNSIVLSAQDRSKFTYRRIRKTVTFRDVPGSFLILDGQHRVYGFALAESELRVPVVVYSQLTRKEECRLFIDINTKQRPVPNELLLDIKALAETETESEASFRALFDRFASDANSALYGLMSPASKSKGRLSRVTFNSAIRSVWSVFEGADAHYAYEVLAAYLQACRSGLRLTAAEDNLTNPTVFRALMWFFADVAPRVSDRFDGDYSVDNFQRVLAPVFQRMKKGDLAKPGNSHTELHEKFQQALRQQFSISR